MFPALWSFWEKCPLCSSSELGAWDQTISASTEDVLDLAWAKVLNMFRQFCFTSHFCYYLKKCLHSKSCPFSSVVLTFLVLWPFNSVPNALATPTIKLFSVILHNCNVAPVINWNINIWYAVYLIFDPCERGVHSPKGCIPPAESHSFNLIPQTSYVILWLSKNKI